jgi:hypothetical protein
MVVLLHKVHIALSFLSLLSDWFLSCWAKLKEDKGVRGPTLPVAWFKQLEKSMENPKACETLTLLKLEDEENVQWIQGL